MLGYRANLTREVISRAQWAAVLVVFLILALISCGSNAQSELPVYSTLPLPTLTISPSPSTLQVPISASPSLDNACQVPIDVSVAVLLNELQSCKSTTLSKDSSSIIRLYLELERFKSDPEFHQFGFGACCRFNSWLRELESLSMTTYGETGTAPGKLVDPLVEVSSAAGRRFNIVGDPREWYIINRQGNLEIRDHFGLYVTAIKVE